MAILGHCLPRCPALWDNPRTLEAWGVYQMCPEKVNPRVHLHPPLYLQHYVHKKFCIAVGCFCRASIFFSSRGNSRKPDPVPIVFCGEVSLLPFQDFPVKAVGGNDIQPAVADLCGQAEIPGGFRYGQASGDGVVHQVSEQPRHVKLQKGERLWKFDAPVRPDARCCGYLMVMAEKGVQRRVLTVICNGVPVKYGFIFRYVRPDAAVIALLGKGGNQSQGMAEIMAELRSLPDVF